MRPILCPGLVILLAFGSAAQATAQAQQLPATSRSEAQVNSLNATMSNQAENRAAAQQNQFEVNALRTQNSVRATVPPPVVVAPPIAGPAR